MICNRLLRHAGFFVFASSIAVCPALAQADVTVYVSASGNDAFDGSAPSYSTGTTGPVKTVAHARDLIRAARAGNTSAHATMYIGAGTYNFSSSLALGSQDSNLTITGATNSGTILTGSVPIVGWDHYMSPALRRRFSLAVQKKLYSSATTANLGVMQHGGYFDITNAPAELLLGGAPMQLVRFPAQGYMNVTSVDSTGQNITTDQARKVASSTDAWMTGFFNNNSSSAIIPVTNAQSGSSYSVSPIPNSLEVPVVGSRVAVLNQPEDLTSPGQYYIDRSSNRIYFYPPAASDAALSSAASVTSLDGPIVDANGADQLQMNSLVFQGSRAQGVRLTSCTNSAISSVVIKSVAQEGLVILGGSNNTFAASEISDTGGQAIYVNSGDLTTLAAGNISVLNNMIQRSGRIEQTFGQGIYMAGVGNTVSSNTFKNMPSSAICFEGANHLIQSNDISNIMQLVNDCGAIYCGRRITDRGNKIDSNIIHDFSGYSSNNLLVGVYIDDCDSGMAVTNNIFSNIPYGVEIGGGRNNMIQGNAFNQVATPVQMDSRGEVGFMKSWFAQGGGYFQELAAMTSAQINLFQQRFPDFAAMYTSNDPGLPANDVVSNNFFPNAQSTINYIDSITASLLSVVNNSTNGNLLFVSPSTGNFNLNPGISVTPTLPPTAGTTATLPTGSASAN